ncbi:peptidase U32 (plasmid) [Vibrio sp. qd031]|nr:peptidase U32 [Vibrio sp. qd031]
MEYDVVKQPFELLAPGGDLDSILAAIAAGADAVYCGLDRFNARNRATNLSYDDLMVVIEIAHQQQCQVFLTLNIMMLESELAALWRLLDRLTASAIDGVIIQDFGLAYLLKHHFPTLDVHASTQMNTHNQGQIAALSQLGASRVNLSRELNIDEITDLASYGKQHGVSMEVFVHGSYCIGFSGLCYISSVRSGASGNRGRCSQPCRDPFEKTDAGAEFPLNMKDNSAFSNMAQLAEAGVYSLKVEGRIKKSHYVFTTVQQWRAQIDAYQAGKAPLTDMTPLYTVFNRDFSNGYLMGNIDKAMYIDNPRNHAWLARAQSNNDASESGIQIAKKGVYDDNTQIMQTMEQSVAPFAQMFNDKRTQRSSTKTPRTHITLPSIESDSVSSEHVASLSILLSDFEQVEQLHDLEVDLFVQLPNALSRTWKHWAQQLSLYPQCSPYFPAVLIDKDYESAVELLKLVTPSLIITDNIGIAIEAQKLGVQWIAGRQLNLSNSYALECLKQEFGASGGFVSNELSKVQMNRIKRPSGFRTFYAVLQPNTLMTSRQCLFMQSSGCKKIKQNNGCLPKCSKRTSIINLNDSPYIINKLGGEYNQLHAQHHTLNLKIIKDHSTLFTDFLIDLRDIQTETKFDCDIRALANGFIQFVAGYDVVGESLQHDVMPTSNHQYYKGV